ncbi:MAG: glycosyltransferase family 4 protein, partial [Verrucomicrobiota bacterium]
MNATQTPGELPRMAFVGELEFGGGATFLYNLTGALVRRGVPVLVVSPKGGNAFASDFQAAGVKVVLQDDRLIFEDRLNAVMQTLAKFRPTAVVGCVGGESYEALRYVPPDIRRIAVIQTDHPPTYDAAIPFAACLDDIVGISTAIARRLETMTEFRTVAKHCLLHGVMIPATFEPRRQSDRLLRILYLGRLMQEQKRVRLFPAILEGLKSSGIPFHWTIAGEGPEREFLERTMNGTPPHQTVSFPGKIPYGDIPRILSEHDVFLLASDHEGLPLSLLEAMGHGLVPVVSDLESGVREVVDATNGMLVPVDEVEGYARAII